MPRRDRPLLRLLVIFIILPTLIIVFFVAKYEINDHISSNILAKELEELGAPEGCREEKRIYGKGSVDVVSRWTVFYNCTGTGGQIYDAITDQMQRHGYIQHRDSVLPPKIPPISYYFAGNSAKFYVIYNLKPLSDVRPRTEANLRAAQVTGFNLEISRYTQPE